jgi:hypothetical protein
MLALFSAWDWTEIVENLAVSLVFVVVPVIAHHEWRHKKLMKSHAELHRKLDAIGETE